MRRGNRASRADPRQALRSAVPGPGRPAAPLLLAVALAGCGGPPMPPPPPVDLTLTLATTTARLEFDQGRPAAAAVSYAAALDRARVMDDPTAVTAAAYALAIARSAAGDDPGGLAAIDEAAHEAGRAGVDPTDIQLVRGRIELRAGHPAEAARSARAALAGGTAAQRAQAHVLLGLAACEAGDVQAARGELTAARADGPPAMVAGLDGDVALLSHDPATAAAAFDRQAGWARRSRDYRTLDRALARAGHAYAAAGDRPAAADRLYRAARAAVGSGKADAAPLTAEAAAAARAAGDATLVRLTADLVDHAGATSRPTTAP